MTTTGISDLASIESESNAPYKLVVVIKSDHRTFNIPAGKAGNLKVAIVCLEHGKKDPNARVKYELKPIETFAKTAESAEVLKMMAEGEIHRDVAQVALLMVLRTKTKISACHAQ